MIPQSYSNQRHSYTAERLSFTTSTKPKSNSLLVDYSRAKAVVGPEKYLLGFNRVYDDDGESDYSDDESSFHNPLEDEELDEQLDDEEEEESDTEQQQQGRVSFRIRRSLLTRTFSCPLIDPDAVETPDQEQGHRSEPVLQMRFRCLGNNNDKTTRGSLGNQITRSNHSAHRGRSPPLQRSSPLQQTSNKSSMIISFSAHTPRATSPLPPIRMEPTEDKSPQGRRRALTPSKSSRTLSKSPRRPALTSHESARSLRFIESKRKCLKRSKSQLSDISNGSSSNKKTDTSTWSHLKSESKTEASSTMGDFNKAVHFTAGSRIRRHKSRDA